MKYMSILFSLLLMVACMSQNRTAQWLLEAERHSRNGDRDSVLQILYKINEEKLVGEEKHTFYRLMSGCMLASVPAEMEQLYETMAYYEEMKDTANLRTMRSVLVSNHCYRNEYQKVDPTQATMASGSSPVMSRNCSRASSPTTCWKSRTIMGKGWGPNTEPMQ